MNIPDCHEPMLRAVAMDPAKAADGRAIANAITGAANAVMAELVAWCNTYHSADWPILAASMRTLADALRGRFGETERAIMDFITNDHGHVMAVSPRRGPRP